MNRRMVITAAGAMLLIVVAASSAMAVNLGILGSPAADNVGEMQIQPVTVSDVAPLSVSSTTVDDGSSDATTSTATTVAAGAPTVTEPRVPTTVRPAAAATVPTTAVPASSRPVAATTTTVKPGPTLDGNGGRLDPTTPTRTDDDNHRGRRDGRPDDD
jgi:cytoskeletal protein RodZ